MQYIAGPVILGEYQEDREFSPNKSLEMRKDHTPQGQNTKLYQKVNNQMISQNRAALSRNTPPTMRGLVFSSLL